MSTPRGRIERMITASSSRVQRMLGYSAPALALTFVSVALSSPLAAQDGPRYAGSGAYTDQQADRGERAYGRTCAHCHGLSLEGDGAHEIPALMSDAFSRRWRGKTVQALFDTLIRSMPADDRGTLTPPAASDLVAYLLRANGAPAGESPLPSEREPLGRIVIGDAP
jgi:mono/diheme cytochrome c family protein